MLTAPQQRHFHLEQVDGTAFAAQAGELLNELWPMPAMDYTPAYMDWQLRFPAQAPPPTVAAFFEGELAGFAAATPRRFRLGGLEEDGFIASFWCLRPGAGGPAGAIFLIERLVGLLRDATRPFLTFGVNGGRGEQLFPLSCRRSGFVEVDLGLLPACSAMIAGPVAHPEWTVHEDDPAGVLPALADQTAAAEPARLSIAPHVAQTRHYCADPRRRRFLMATHRDSGRQAGAWVIDSVTRTGAGLRTVPTLDSFLGSREDRTALPALLAAARPDPDTPGPVVVNAPSLGFLEPAELRPLGIRQTGKGFHARLYLPPALAPWQAARYTGIEVV